jgi:hypothetical protein
MRLRTKVAACALAAGAALGTGETVKAAIPLPPPSGLVVWHTGTVKTWLPNAGANGVCRISTAPHVNWLRHPRKRRLTIGHYAKIRVEIMAQAGYNGTLWKAVTSRSYTSPTKWLSVGGLPVYWGFPLGYNVAHGLVDYRSRTTVRIIRDVRPGLNTTAWKGVYWGEPNRAGCGSDSPPGGGGNSPPAG